MLLHLPVIALFSPWATASLGLPDVSIVQLHEMNAAGELAEFTRMGRVELTFSEDDE